MLVVILCGCSTSTHIAPVTELKWHSHLSNQRIHIVTRGETLYSIAFRYDKDYRQLARYNQVMSPYLLHVGQIIRLDNSQLGFKHAYVAHYTKKVAHAIQPRIRPLVTKNNNSSWRWPAKGVVKVNFQPQNGKKGIDIAGKRGQGVYASQEGIVAYAGNGIAGYGNLIIIQHKGQFLTAYAHNERNIVHEGQHVKALQRIADMGKVNGRYWGVHFEIRRAGQPINPLNYLK